MSNPVQIVDNLALVPLTASEVASLNLQSMGVVTIISPNAPGAMLTSQFATINPGAGYVDKAITAQSVPYTGLTGLPGNQALFLRADGTFATPPGQTYSVVTTAGPGLAPTLPGSSGFAYFLRGDGAWQLISSLTIAYSQLTGVPLTFPPAAHALQHITGGNDVIPSATTVKSGLVPILPAVNVTVSFLRGDNSWQQIPIVSTSAAGFVSPLPTINPTVQFFRGDGNYAQPVYAQLASIPTSFNPSPHASQHITGGNDIIPNFLVGGGVSGLVPGSPGGTTAFLRADGVWAAPQGPGNLSSSSGAGLLQQLPLTNQSLYYLRGDNVWVLISSLAIDYSQLTNAPVFAGGSAGLVPNSLGGTVNFLRADGVFAAPIGSSLASSSGPGIIAQLPASGQTGYYARGDNSWQLVSSLTFAWTQITSGVPTSFTPSPHQSSHITGGSDVIPGATTAKSGLVPPLPTSNSGTSFLRGDGVFATIPIAAPGTPGLVPSPTNILNQWLRGDGTFSIIPTVTGAVFGLVPPFPGNTTTFFRGDGTYNPVTYASLSGIPTNFTPSAHATQHITGGNDIIPNFTAVASGLAPLSGGGTSSFLRADGTWTTPAGGGDVSHTRQILTINSLTGGGNLSADLTLSLVNDAATPGNWQLYSTNAGGTRGWNASIAFPQATASVAGLVPTPSGVSTQFLSGAATFITPSNFTSTTPGYAPLSGGGAINFLRADGQWVIPPSASLATTSAGGIVPQLPSSSGPLYYLRGDNSWQLVSGLSIGWGQLTGVPIFSGLAEGLVPFSTGNASQFLRGDGPFATPPQASSGAAGYISALPASNTTAYWARGDNSWQVLPDSALVLSPWTMPTIGSDTPAPGVVVTDSTIFSTGMTVLTGGPSTTCFMEVTGKADSTHVTLKNQGYAINPVPTTSISGGLIFIVGPAVMSGLSGGFVPLPPNDATKYLGGDGNWTVPAASSGTVSVTNSIAGNGSVGTPLQLVNDVGNPGPSFAFYSTDANGNKGWFPLTFSWETNASFVLPGVGATQTVAFTNTVGMTSGTTLVFEDSNVPAHQAFLEVVSVNVDGVHAVVKNQGYALNPNPSPTVTFAISASVTLAGPGVAAGVFPGFVPPPPNNTTTFLRGDGTFATPANFSTSAPGYVPIAPVSTTQFLCANGTWAAPSVGSLATTGVQGAVPGLPASNQTISFLQGDNTWQLMSTISGSLIYANIPGIPTSLTPTSHHATHISTGSDIIPLFDTASTTSGLVPGSNSLDITHFLRADQTWATTPASPGLATSGTDGLLKGLQSSAQTTYYLGGDNLWHLISSLPIDYSQLTGTFPVHGAQHIDNGTDPVPVVAGLRTGLVPVLPSAAPTTKFLRGDATWTVIPAVSNSVAGLVPAWPNNTTTYFRGDGTYAAVPAATSTTSGLVPTPPNLTYQWLRGDASFAALPFTWNITTSFTQPTVGNTVSGVVFTSTTALVAGMAIATVDNGNQTNYYTVSSITDGTHAVLINTGANGNTAALSTVNAGTVKQSGLPIMTSTGTGIVPIPPADGTKFLSGLGTWTVPPSTGVTTARLVATTNSLRGGGDLNSDRTLDLQGDTASPGNWWLYGTNGSGTKGWNSSTSLPVTITGTAGLAPALPSSNPTTTFLRGDGTWTAPSGITPASTGVAGTVNGLPASNQTTQWLRADNSWTFLPNTNATTSSWQMPAVGVTVTAVTFQSTAAFAVGETLFFSTGSSATNCFMEVMNISSGTQADLRNRGYVINPVSTTTIPTCQVTVVGPGIATSAATGLVPLPPNNTTTFLRGDATFTQANYPDLTNLPNIQVNTLTAGTFTQPSAGNTVSIPVVSETGFSTPGRGIFVVACGYYEVVSTSAGIIVARNTGFLYNSQFSGTIGGSGGSAKAVIGAGFAGLFSSTVAGAVPPSAGGTTNFLRADGSWNAPSGSGGNPYNTTFSAFTVPAINTTVPVTVASTSDLLTGQTHVLTDGTLFMIGRVTGIASLVVTYSNQGGGGSVSGSMGAGHVYMASAITAIDNNTAHFLSGANTFITPPSATATVAGYVPTPPNDTSKWFRGDATWAVSPPLTVSAGSTFTWPAVGGTSASIQVADSTLLIVGSGVYVPGLGLAEVMSKADGTHMVIRNNGNTNNAGSTAGVAIGTQFYAAGAGALATGTSSGMIAALPNNTTTFLRGDNTFATPPSATATVTGYVPTPPNDTSKFLRGDATWVTPFNAGQATVNFGSVDTGDDSVASATVSAAWINSGTKFIQVAVIPGSDHADEDPWVENISVYTQNIINSTSFDIVLHAPTGAVGNYLVNYLSN